MRDLLVITPTRGRPERVLRLASAIHRTATAKTDLCLAFDDDDETMAETMQVLGSLDNVTAMHGSRQGLGPWTNQVAQAHFGQYRAYASLGDDHLPRTLGWDYELLGQLDREGPGFVAPNGIITPGFPEACAISAEIVEALGWMCLPGLSHWYVDQVWYDLGRQTGTYWWMQSVMVEHRQDASDATGSEAWVLHEQDRYTYANWLGSEGFDEAVATVRKAVGE